jgi:nicotinate-nucleotide adenylyltransferase
LEQQGGRTLVRDVHYLPVSSTQVRAAAAAGEPIDTLVPPPVARYIAKNSLYQEP